MSGCVCDKGWTGRECADDADECSDPSVCSDPLTECVNFDGSYSCICHYGYAYDSNAGKCEGMISSVCYTLR